MNERWMKDMQDRFADFEKPAPEGLFADVQREMQRRGLVPGEELAKQESETKTKAERGKLIPMWLRGVAAAAMLAIMAGVGTLLLTEDKDGGLQGTDRQLTQTPSTYQAEPKTSLIEVEAITAPEQEVDKPRLLAQNRPSEGFHSGLETEPVKPNVVEGDGDVVERVDNTDVESLDEVVEQAQIEEIYNLDSDRETKSVRPEEAKGNERVYSRDRENPFRRKTKKKGWEVGANIAGVQGLSNPTYKYLAYANSLSYNDQAYFNDKLTMGQVAVAGDNTPTTDALATASYSNAAQSLDGSVGNQAVSNYSNQFVTTRALLSSVVFANKQLQRMYVDAHHRQPVKVGVSMRYHFNNRLSVQTGIDYSYHSSELVRQIGNSQIKVDQKLHFVGVPVALSFSIWSPGMFNFYISAGGEVEKVIKGTQSTVSLTTNVADRKDKEGVEEKPWQFSVVGSGGVQFNINHLLSLYAEPGVAYYFDNKSEVPTIYQEKPFNFNLNMGLRFNINRK